MKNPTVYEWQSSEYEGYIVTLATATAVQNLRNRYTGAMRAGEPNPFGKHIPRKPSKAELACIVADREWKRDLKGRTDAWWMRRINKSIEENFYRAKVACLIWWELVIPDDHGLNSEKWRDKFKHYDFDSDLFTDLDLTEYALHCCGFPPAKARQMVFDIKDRKKWREYRLRVYDCVSCKAELSNFSCVPTECTNCGNKTTLRPRKQHAQK